MGKSNYNGITLKSLQPMFALVVNLVLAYLVYFVARIAFLFENYSFFKAGLDISHLWQLFRGGLMFDTSAIVYSNALYILLILFPIWVKETDIYHRICRWLFVIINSVGLFINLCDAVYFPFTLRRTTTSVFKEFSNEHNLGNILGTEIIHHWYFVLLFIIVSWGLYQLYRTPKLSHFDFKTIKQR